ncbi:MAG: glycosyltransferase family 39 protein [Anaerolineales bacterium]|nr:glycosyltransferase family 39 protein [Anaerolineales bacterium]MCB9145412.1 glycosyltransferase family 39 protein [Anaerolineales bacterium]
MMKPLSARGEKYLLLALLVVMILPSWLLQNDRMLNVDEPRWIVRGANFYYAVTHAEFENTIFEYHPGVTNMWIVATAMHIYFPEYRGYGQGYFDPLKMKFEEFMRQHDKEPLDLVRISRYIHAAVLLALAMASYLLLSKLVDPRSAFLSITLAAVSPFYLGHSRLMNLEGMLALFVLLSLLSLQVYLTRERKIFYLAISGAAFGLAQLSKSSSIAVVGVIGLMLLWDMLSSRTPWRGRIMRAVYIFIAWFVAAALTYFILWPGMWVAPGKMLKDVYGNAFSYAFQGARLEVTEELAPQEFELEDSGNGFLYFMDKWADSTTPLTWFGLLLTIPLFLYAEDKKTTNSMLVYLAVLGLGFVLMFGLAQGRDSQHYILSSYIAFDVMAGLGWGWAIMQMKTRFRASVYAGASATALVLLPLAQIAQGLPYAPYYFTYKSPIASEAATYGYGEGFAEAGDYLAMKPGASNLRAYVYNGLGTFSFFFPGETVVLKRVYLLNNDFAVIVEELSKADYLVLYPITRTKQPETEQLLGVLEGVVEPEKIITINGLEYIRIYAVSEIPESVYEALMAMNVPQE